MKRAANDNRAELRVLKPAVIDEWHRRLGRLMREEREHADISMVDLAEAVGVNLHTVKFWETGVKSPPLPMLLRYCTAIGVTIREVLP